MIRLTVDRTDAGIQELVLPECQYTHVLVINNSAHHLILSTNRHLTLDGLVGECPAYSVLSFPLPAVLQTVYVSRSGGAFAGERGHLYFLTHDPGMVGQFRPPPDRPDRTLPGRRVYGGVPTAGTVLVTASTKVVLHGIYLTNRLATAGTLTLMHRVAGVDTPLVEGVSIPGNSMFAIGYVVLGPGDNLLVTAVTGTIAVSLYGDGS